MKYITMMMRNNSDLNFGVFEAKSKKQAYIDFWDYEEVDDEEPFSVVIYTPKEAGNLLLKLAKHLRSV